MKKAIFQKTVKAFIKPFFKPIYFIILLTGTISINSIFLNEKDLTNYIIYFLLLIIIFIHM